MIDILKDLCRLPGVSGTEDAVRAYIASRARPFADEITTDAMGNLLILKKGKAFAGKKLMLCAHMDEIGVMITHIGEEGYLKFDFAGGVVRETIIGKRVVIGDGVPGVIGIKAVHLTTAEERKTVPKLDDMYIDIGAFSAGEAEKRVSIGDTGWLESEPLEFGNGFFKARNIDDRVGCAVMLKLLEEKLPFDCYFVFTVQEEVGCRGAFGAAFRIKPDIALVLEGTTSADMPGISGNKKICSPGAGVVLPFMDRGTIYDKTLRQKLIRLAEESATPWQTKQYVAGGTDGSAIQRSGTGIRTAAMAVPVRNIHTVSGIMKIGDMEGMCRLARLFLHQAGELL